MTDYVQEISQLEQVGGEEPGFFWLRDFDLLFQLLANETEGMIGVDLTSLSFNDQVELAMSIPQLRQVYGRDIVRDADSGNITASRTLLLLRDFDQYVFI